MECSINDSYVKVVDRVVQIVHILWFCSVVLRLEDGINLQLSRPCLFLPLFCQFSLHIVGSSVLSA